MNESDLGELKANVSNLVTICTEIKSSMNRLGERTGDLESKQKDCEKDTAVLKTDLGNVKEKVTDLQTGRNWLVGGVLTTYGALIWDWMRGK